MALCPEGRRIFQQMTVRENLEMGSFTRPDKEIPGSIEQMFELLPAPEGAPKADCRHALRRRAADAGHGARADVQAASLLMLDEPSMGLAPILVEQIFDIIRALHKRGTTILLVEQNAQMALSVANRALCAGNRQDFHVRRRAGAAAQRCSQEGVSGGVMPSSREGGRSRFPGFSFASRLTLSCKYGIV